MRLRKCFKRIAALSFAAAMLAVGLPQNSVVRADDDYPDEILFPISVLDFRADNLLFEWSYTPAGLDLYSGDDNNGGKGLLEDTLDSEGYPVYKKATVERLAKKVRTELSASRGDVLNASTWGGIKNPLSLHSYVVKDYREDVLTKVYAMRYKNGADIAEGDASFVRWKLSGTHTYAVGYDPTYGQNGKWPVVYEVDPSTGAKTPLYSVEYNGIVLIKPGIEVSRTVENLVPGRTYKCKIGAKTDQTLVYVNGAGISAGINDTQNVVADSSGKITVTLKLKATASSLPTVSDWYSVEAEGGTLTGGASETVSSSFSGNKGVKWSGSGTATYKIYSSQAGTRNIRLYYAAGTVRSYTLKVNGASQVVSCSATTSWTTLAATPVTASITLKEGENTIQFSGVGTLDAPTLDKFEIQKTGAVYSSAPIAENGWLHFEAEDGAPSGSYYIMRDGTGTDNKAWACSGQAGIGNMDPSHGASYKYRFYSETAGTRRMRIYYMSGSGRTLRVTVNGTAQDAWCPANGNWWAPGKDPTTININVNAGWNDIVLSNKSGDYAPNVDYFEIDQEYLANKIEDIVFINTADDYPLGNYAASKDKYDYNPSLGWYDITTCMDYAYFVTKHLFRYHESLNTQVSDYENIIFHKIIKDGKVAYEFAGDSAHKTSYPNLILNETEKTVRNKTATDPGTRPGDRIVTGGNLFLADGVPHKTYIGQDFDKLRNDDYGNKRNFHYTVCTKSKFVYKAGASQYFDFTGDDDVYVFVNGYLLVDLGGAHTPLNGKFNLDTLYHGQQVYRGEVPASTYPTLPSSYIKEWGLTDGAVVDFSFFYMERHSSGSNFYGMMNFKLASDMVKDNLEYDELPYGYLVDLNYSFTTLRELNTNKKLNFTDNFGNEVGVNGFKLGDGVFLRDNKLKVTVTKEDGTVDTARSKVFTFADANSPTTAEINAVKTYFANLSVTLNETVQLFGLVFDTASKPYADDTLYMDADPGPGRVLPFKPKVTYEAWQEGAKVPTSGSASISKMVTMVTGKVTLETATSSAGNQKQYLADYGAFTLTREATSETEESLVYTNDPAALGTTKIYVLSEEVPIGEYTLKLDDTVLSGYTVTINDEEVDELTLDLTPTYNENTKHWKYPDVRFVLKAVRDLIDLKDLT